jgi:hypothetical protein
VRGKHGAREVHFLDITTPGEEGLSYRVQRGTLANALLPGSFDRFWWSYFVKQFGVADIAANVDGDSLKNGR